MAAKEVPAAIVALTSPVKQGDPIKHDVQTPASIAIVNTPTLHSDASPTQPLSPQHQFPALPSQGTYPKPLATHEAVIADEALFMDTFYKFHTALKSKTTIPKMGGKDLDLHLLYREVTSRGGLQAVIKDRKWKEITLVFQFPRTTTSASFVLRKYYVTLLYHYEQVYRNGVTGPLILPPASFSASSPSVQVSESALSEGGNSVVRKRVRKRKEPKAPEIPTVDPAEAIGTTVVGSIEGKLDFGYLVSMVVGGENLKGILYHVPPGNKGPQYASLPGLLNSVNSDLVGTGAEVQTRRKRRRKEEMPKKDPNAPRPNRTGYNFFFAEQRQRLKALHPEKDREISRMIGEAWNALSEVEKTPYQERGVKDKERFKREFRDYREKQKLANGQGPGEGTVTPQEPINGDHSVVKAVEIQQPAGTPGFVPTQIPSGPSLVSEQLKSSAPNAISLVPTQ